MTTVESSSASILECIAGALQGVKATMVKRKERSSFLDLSNHRVSTPLTHWELSRQYVTCVHLCVLLFVHHGTFRRSISLKNIKGCARGPSVGMDEQKDTQADASTPLL